MHPSLRRLSRFAPGFLKRRARRARSRHHHEHPTYTEAELLARAEEFNRNAELHWRKIAAEEAGRAHVLNKPFSTVRDTPDILYRLGLVLQSLDLGVGMTVLDFGAGSCWLSSSINRLRCRTVSVDVSATALRMGEELFRSDSRHHLDLEPQFLAYDGHRVALPDASVDRAVCFDSFHHVPNQDEVLAELYRVLRPGGRLVLAEPGEGHSHMDQSVYETETHGVLENDLHLDELQTKAKAAGFRDMWMKPYPNPEAITLTADEYQRLVDGDDSVYPMEALQASLRHFYIVILTKGEPRFDSRNPRRLEARIAPTPSRVSGLASSTLAFRARVENTGDTTWLHEPTSVGGYVMLGGHLLRGSRERIGIGFLRAELPRDVAPGEAVELLVSLPTPATPGQYIVQLDMVDEFVAWFEQTGSKTVDLELDVTGYRDSRDPHRLAAALERVGPWPQGPVRPGSLVLTRFRLTNTGDTTWWNGAPGERGAACLGAHLFSGTGAVLAQDHLRLPLPRPVPPGESIEVDASVPAPRDAGEHRVRFDLVAEQVSWFEQMGSPVLEETIAGSDELPDSRQPGRLLARLERLDAAADAAIDGPAGGQARLRLRATNAGNTRWLATAGKEVGCVALGSHLLDEAGALVEQDFLRAPLGGPVAPGERAELSVEVGLPKQRGRYVLELDMVDEGIAWFASHGSETLRIPLSVR